jgi:hypothetical protein
VHCERLIIKATPNQVWSIFKRYQKYPSLDITTEKMMIPINIFDLSSNMLEHYKSTTTTRGGGLLRRAAPIRGQPPAFKGKDSFDFN